MKVLIGQEGTWTPHYWASWGTDNYCFLNFCGKPNPSTNDEIIVERKNMEYVGTASRSRFIVKSTSTMTSKSEQGMYFITSKPRNLSTKKWLRSA